MRQSYRIIPIYTSDVSGVCSALYELGGMVVMHDPSGCNSTYNTHDEIRWYDQDSLIFISGLTEIDAVMGNDEKFLSDIKEAAREFHPKFIALVSSPIPFMNGTDFPALAKVLEIETGIPSFAVPTNGMHDYVYGAGIAFEEIAKRFVTEKETRENHVKRIVNLLGITPLDFGPISKVEELKKNLEQYGWKIISTWAMGDTLEDLSNAGNAEVNLVVSSVGLRAARALKEKYGTPYVIGTPYKEYAERISEALEKRIRLPALEDRGKENLQGTGNGICECMKLYHLNRGHILAANMIHTFLALYILFLPCYIGISIWMGHANLNGLLTIIPALLLIALLIAGIATFSRSTFSANICLLFVVLVLAYCGGGLLPDVLLPKVIQQIRPYLPGTYVMQIFCHALY